MGIDHEYIVPVVDGVYIEDKFDLIFYRDKKTYVIKWAFNHKMKNEFMHVAEMASMYKAFFHQYGNKIHTAEFGYYDLISPKPEFIKYDVGSGDIDALVYWCSEIQKEETFPSRRGLTTYCKSCPFDKPCSKWVAWSKKEAQI